jgi:tRNA(fMet)-specific endonuclease VapC
MGGNKYLLDTVIVIAYFNRELSILQHLQESSFVVPSIVIGELYYGGYRSARAVDNVRQVQAFAASNTILPCNEVTAEFYGQIKQKLRSKGRPIPENDIWIAAIALQHRLPLVSRDAHFREIEGLSLAIW